jgi:hypothetical protein
LLGRGQRLLRGGQALVGLLGRLLGLGELDALEVVLLDELVDLAGELLELGAELGLRGFGR